MMPVLVTATQRRRRSRWQRAAVDSVMCLTRRDEALVEAVWRLRFATCDQLCDLLFSPGARSRCQRRLTLLFRHRYLDKVPDRAASEPDIYFLGRGAGAGVRLMRARSSTRDVLRRGRRMAQIDHVLAVNDIRCRLYRAARARGLGIVDWRDQGDLNWMGREVRVIPDAYFVLRWPVGDRVAAMPCFLEVERSPRNPRAVLEKYERLARFRRSGGYTQHFKRHSLRLLVVTAAASQDVEGRWAARLSELADRAQLDFGLFASRREFLASDCEELFRAPIWRRPGTDGVGGFGEPGG